MIIILNGYGLIQQAYGLYISGGLRPVSVSTLAIFIYS